VSAGYKVIAVPIERHPYLLYVEKRVCVCKFPSLSSFNNNLKFASLA